MKEAEKPYETVDEYIQLLPDDIKAYIIEVRNTIQKSLPNAKEKISWKMPTYWDKHNIIHFAAHKK
ncbi:MAG: hypothetical protein GX584_02350, partial [Clostridiaceae bacterium]|nr:hypothetical protein [Clostridiaceae bacterium]